MNKAQLVDAIAAKADLSKAQAKVALEDHQWYCPELERGDAVQLVSFSTFKDSPTAQAAVGNLKLVARIQIAAANVPSFVAGKALKNAVK